MTFLERLAEFERRQLFVPLGFASLFDYLTRYLRLPNGSAYRRMVCARLLARFPQAGERLRDGRLSLASLAKLKDALNAENVEELFERAAGRTVEEVEQLACAYAPRPVPQRDVLRREAPVPVALALPAGSSAPPPAEKVDPLTEERFRWHLSFGRAVRDKLERARALLSHELPDGDGEAILERALDALLAKLERRKGLVARPRTAELPASMPGERYVPAAVRRAVWERDGGRCTWPVEGGGICGSTYQVEFDHDLEVALGGASTVENVRLRCRRHNLQKAALHLGRAFMQKFTALDRRDGTAKSGPERGDLPWAASCGYGPPMFAALLTVNVVV